jgi:hypothetical protein
MKHILLYFFCFFYLFSAAQNYKVIHVNGSIQKIKNKKLINRGSTLEQEEKLNYLTQNARAIIVDTKAGKRLILQNESMGESTVNASIAPSMGNISSRGSMLNQAIDVQHFFSGKLVAINLLKIPINAKAFPQCDTQFFFVSYSYQGELINKKIPHLADTLLIHKDSLFKLDGVDIKTAQIQDVSLSYYIKNKGLITTTLVSDSIHFVFPDTAALKHEVIMLLPFLEGKSQKDKIEFVKGYLHDAYGKTYHDNVWSWYRRTFIKE